MAKCLQSCFCVRRKSGPACPSVHLEITVMDSNTSVAESIHLMPTRLRRGTTRRTRGNFRRLFLSALCGTGLLLSLPEVACADGGLTPLLPPPSVTSSTVPPNGDVNPYGVAFVPHGFPRFGTIRPGDLLVSNFNNKANLQGTGSTIVKIVPNGKPVVFFQGGRRSWFEHCVRRTQGWLRAGRQCAHNRRYLCDGQGGLAFSPEPDRQPRRAMDACDGED